MNLCMMRATFLASLAIDVPIMTGSLLLRGMLAGIFSALLAFGFARVFGEPPLDLAIAYEEAGSLPVEVQEPGTAVENHQHLIHDTEVSRTTQAGIGLFTGLAVFGAGLGGAFATAFALMRGRVGPSAPITLSMLLAFGGFVVVALVPGIKYPATPPAIGTPETIGFRTCIFLGMMALSIVSAILAFYCTRLVAELGYRRLALPVGLAAFVLLVVLCFRLMPSVNEVPTTFPYEVLLAFRLASLGTQAVLWVGIGIAFGFAAKNVLGPLNGNSR